MTHAAVVTYLKCGFHRRRIPWGFNADHQPIGGRFDAIEEELVQGCAFASYITFDLSPELAVTPAFDDAGGRRPGLRRARTQRPSSGASSRASPRWASRSTTPPRSGSS